MSGKKMANWTVGKIMVLAVLVQLAGAPPAVAIGPCEARKRLEASKRLRDGSRPPFALGDSVMLGAAEAVARAGIKVDARGCRQMKDGLDILARRKRRRRLPRVVIVALGTNWRITAADTRRALRILGPRQRLVVVTPRQDAADAAVLRRAARRHPRRVCLADWARRSAGHPEWAPGDGIHLSAAGIREYVRLLRPYRRLGPPKRDRCP